MEKAEPEVRPKAEHTINLDFLPHIFGHKFVSVLLAANMTREILSVLQSIYGDPHWEEGCRQWGWAWDVPMKGHGLSSYLLGDSKFRARNSVKTPGEVWLIEMNINLCSILNSH